MSNPYSISLAFLLFGFLTGSSFLFLFRRQNKKCYAALVCGVFVAILNFCGAYIAHRMDWWHLSGAWMAIGVPVSEQVGWVFLGAGYCLAYSLTDNPTHYVRAKFLFVLGTCVYGVFNDYLFLRLGVLQLGAGMKIYYTFPYWVLLTGLMVGMFEFLSPKRNSLS